MGLQQRIVAEFAQPPGQQLHQPVARIGGQVRVVRQDAGQHVVQIGVEIEGGDAQVQQKFAPPANGGQVYHARQLQRVFEAAGDVEVGQRPQFAGHGAEGQAANGRGQAGVIDQDFDLLGLEPAKEARQVQPPQLPGGG